MLRGQEKRRKRSLIKTVVGMQQGHEHPHGCNQRVLLVVQNMDNGDLWTTEWVGRLKGNLPITNYVGTGDEDDEGLVKYILGFHRQFYQHYIEHLLNLWQQHPWGISNWQLLAHQSYSAQGASADVGENDMFKIMTLSGCLKVLKTKRKKLQAIFAHNEQLSNFRTILYSTVPISKLHQNITQIKKELESLSTEDKIFWTTPAPELLHDPSCFVKVYLDWYRNQPPNKVFYFLDLFDNKLSTATRRIVLNDKNC